MGLRNYSGLITRPIVSQTGLTELSPSISGAISSLISRYQVP